MDDLDPFITFLIASAAIATPTMLAIKAFFEMRTSQIKLTNSINEIKEISTQSPKQSVETKNSKKSLLGPDIPILWAIGFGLVLGFFAFGLSLVFFIYTYLIISMFIIFALCDQFFKLTTTVSKIVMILNEQHKETKSTEQDAALNSGPAGQGNRILIY